MIRKRITDTERLDWLSQTKAGVIYQSSKVGPGWIRPQVWFVRVGKDTAESGTSLRDAIDGAMSQESLRKAVDLYHPEPPPLRPKDRK